MSLSSLGLTDFEENVYRDLLRGRDTATGDPDGLRATLERLSALGLIRFDPAGRPIAVEPEVGISRLIRRRLLETNAEQRRISAAWEAVHLLSAQQRGPDRTVTIEQIHGADRIDERIRSLTLDAREVLAMQPERHRSYLPAHLQRLEDGARRRTIVSRQSLLDPALMEHCLELHRAGDHHRVVDDDGQQMVIVDRSVVFVPSEPEGAGRSALMISQAGVVATMADLFERVWAHAQDLEPCHAPSLTTRERRVLYLLAGTRKDEVAAREMGVSLRTYRRYVAELLERLGAANRFQGALLAKQQGWI
ncbi:helix-turn-helix transcriptional regulator [Nonomuraea gerenzanensis]|uniref:Putative two-component system response regulator n=1 Tax=Nonomuraea gerenzanensis TaxID=93944 RepID=A0A1M4EB88_9ACTN|nr:LuxR family transcriptional regulator [Nonomuraea gerenzanensis]UBU18338.1 LuxR C-terminal-related transcriptional regulator [Nonomuraea gerenzanensis]SBO96165.1 putative two-component system response regulator [Nonomuraea gerenzanensis]